MPARRCADRSRSAARRRIRPRSTGGQRRPLRLGASRGGDRPVDVVRGGVVDTTRRSPRWPGPATSADSAPTHRSPSMNCIGRTGRRRRRVGERLSHRPAPDAPTAPAVDACGRLSRTFTISCSPGVTSWSGRYPGTSESSEMCTRPSAPLLSRRMNTPYSTTRTTVADSMRADLDRVERVGLGRSQRQADPPLGPVHVEHDHLDLVSDRHDRPRPTRADPRSARCGGSARGRRPGPPPRRSRRCSRPGRSPGTRASASASSSFSAARRRRRSRSRIDTTMRSWAGRPRPPGPRPRCRPARAASRRDVAEQRGGQERPQAHVDDGTALDLLEDGAGQRRALGQCRLDALPRLLLAAQTTTAPPFPGVVTGQQRRGDHVAGRPGRRRTRRAGPRRSVRRPVGPRPRGRAPRRP